ncbi:MAG: ribonucleoside-diphosphate reductase subunit alpha [Proteobacteria bacterium]|nr:ribonucleoside-diphosphate reductase subunit alpha [Pseudomonadota bacterium]
MQNIPPESPRVVADIAAIQTQHSKGQEGQEGNRPLGSSTPIYPGPSQRKNLKDLAFVKIQQFAGLIFEDTDNSKKAASKLAEWIHYEVSQQGISSFSQSIDAGFKHGLVNLRLRDFVLEHGNILNAAIQDSQDGRFEYFGIRTIYDRYLLKNPLSRDVIETPQQFFMRVACALSQNPFEAIELYGLYSSFEFLSSSPTLFNAGTRHEQLSSCFLLDSPDDSLVSIYDKYKDTALLSKFSGGIGLSFSRVRSRGSLIKSTNGYSNGVIPWLKTLDSSVAAVNQGGKRKGAACVYLESWHADIEEFLELRDSTGDDQRRAHNLNIANWINDLFMTRVANNELWSLFDPKCTPELVDLYGEDFEAAYLMAERAGKFNRQVKARDLYARMMKTLAQTGNGWMTFKDSSNRKCNQTAVPGRTVHLSNLCTEIIEVTNNEETAVCNLGSLNLAAYINPDGSFDWDRLGRNAKIAVRHLNRVIDLNFYPIATAQKSNLAWRPVGLGVMGLQDVFFIKKWPFDSDEARAFNAKVQEEIYFAALSASCELAELHGPHRLFPETRTAFGELQFDAWGVVPNDIERWEALRVKIKKHGLRNSLLIAIAPTATIGSIVGSYECIEPQVSNLFKRETLSGEFLQVNRHLATHLKELGLWTDSIRAKIKQSEGSIQGIEEIPEALRKVYRTSWEIPMRSLIDMAADRGAFIDQSQSLNLFVENPTIGVLSSMYMYAWQKGLKSTYYLRSRPATKISKIGFSEDEKAGEKMTGKITGKADPTVEDESAAKSIQAQNNRTFSDAAAVSCSLENPTACEACQ